MCFSAGISFGVGGCLAVSAGVIFIRAKKRNKILSAIPLLFGIQQAFEGIQWLCLEKGQPSKAAGYGFLFFALILWPIYVPLMVYLLDPLGRKWAKWMILSGTIEAVYFSGMLLIRPLGIHEVSGSIRYALDLDYRWLAIPVYFLSILVPLLFSGIRIFRGFGIALAIMAFISWRFYESEFISVWCFFAAVLSAMLLVYVLRSRSSGRNAS